MSNNKHVQKILDRSSPGLGGKFLGIFGCGSEFLDPWRPLLGKCVSTLLSTRSVWKSEYYVKVHFSPLYFHTKTKTFTCSRFLAYKVKYFKLFLVSILMIMAHSSWKVSQKYHIRRWKKRQFTTQECWHSGKCLPLGFLLQKLLHQCGRGTEALGPWHCSSVTEAQVALMAAFSSSLLLGLASGKKKSSISWKACQLAEARSAEKSPGRRWSWFLTC